MSRAAYPASLPALLIGALCSVALLGSRPAGAVPVMIDATQAASAPRTDAGGGMCSNAIHMGNSAPPFFTVDENGVTLATQLLNQTFLAGMLTAPVTDVASKQSYASINFRDKSNDSVGDFTVPDYPDLWFPFTPQGTPSGNDENFAVRIRGYLNITTPGIQTFALRGDDLAQLTIGTTQVMTSVNAVNGALTRQVQFATAGLYPFEVLLYNDSQAILEMSHVAGVFPEQNNNTLDLDLTPYQLWSAPELYSAVAGTGTCQECAATAACAVGNYCRDSLCQPCILPSECGPSCVACTGQTPICEVQDNNPLTARCVQCTSNADCPSGTCNLTTGLCTTPGCTSDNQCPLGEYCATNGQCTSCPTGEEAVARAPGDIKSAPQCIKAGYRGSWGCQVAPLAAGQGDDTEGKTRVLLLAAAALLALVGARRRFVR